MRMIDYTIEELYDLYTIEKSHKAYLDADQIISIKYADDSKIVIKPGQIVTVKYFYPHEAENVTVKCRAFKSLFLDSDKPKCVECCGFNNAYLCCKLSRYCGGQYFIAFKEI